MFVKRLLTFRSFTNLAWLRSHIRSVYNRSILRTSRAISVTNWVNDRYINHNDAETIESRRIKPPATNLQNAYLCFNPGSVLTLTSMGGGDLQRKTWNDNTHPYWSTHTRRICRRHVVTEYRRQFPLATSQLWRYRKCESVGAYRCRLKVWTSGRRSGI